jgi:hypothetical protein
MTMIEDDKVSYLRGYSQGYREGHKDGIENKSRQIEICKICGIDLDHGKMLQYTCKIPSCDYSEKGHLKND